MMLPAGHRRLISPAVTAAVTAVTAGTAQVTAVTGEVTARQQGPWTAVHGKRAKQVKNGLSGKFCLRRSMLTSNTAWGGGGTINEPTE